METRVVPVYPQVRRRVLLQRCTGDRHTLDGEREHQRVFGETPRGESVTFGTLSYLLRDDCLFIPTLSIPSSRALSKGSSTSTMAISHTETSKG